MTCVLTSPFHLVGTGYDGFPMSTYQGMQAGSGIDGSHGGYASSAESEPRRQSTGQGKKRPSRAGTRSVSTLSAAQLERKRANDREAQRAIRARTRNTITNLEEKNAELSHTLGEREKAIAVAHQRNRELEEENSYLRNRLGESPYAPPMPRRLDTSRLSDPAAVPVQSTSPSTQASGLSLPPSDSAALSVANSQSSGSRHGSWQQGQPAFDPSGSVTSTNLSSTTPVQVGHPLTAWASHESTHSLQSGSSQMQDPSQPHAQPPYSATAPTERSPWSNSASGYSYPDQQRTSQYQTSPSAPQQPYAPSSYPPAQAPPQSEFQAMNVSSPTAYQMPPAAQAFPPTTQYPISAMGMPSDNAEYSSAQGQMHPPPLPTAHFPSGQSFTAQAAPQAAPPQQQQLQFRDPSGNRTFALPHYSSG